MSTIIYEGKDLEAMGNAENYNDWILKEFDKFVGKKILEVGAGNGNITKLLVARYNVEVIAIEPSNMFDFLKINLKKEIESNKVKVLKGITSEAFDLLKRENIDTIIYNNVLEHISNDQEELLLSYNLLIEGGNVLTFSPAMPKLYSNWDKKLGHFRRYTLTEMTAKMEKAGFKIVVSTYFDFIGMILWWVKYKLLKSESITTGNVVFFDKILVPISKIFDLSRFTKIGKNILVIGKKY